MTDGKWKERLPELLKAIRDNQDDAAAAEIMEHYQTRMINLVASKTDSRADAEDAVQNAFVKMFGNLDKLDDPDRFESWFSTIVVNEARMLTRKNHSRKNIPFSELDNEEDEMMYDPADESEEFRPDLQLDKKTTKDMINEILDSLTEEQKIIVVMHFYEGKKLREIAEELNLAQSTVTGRFQTAKDNIRASVNNIHKKYDLKLYSAAYLPAIPFFRWLLSNNGQDPTGLHLYTKAGAAGAAGTVSAVSSKTAAASAGTASGTAEAITTGTAAKMTAGAGAAIAGKTAGASLGVKLLAVLGIGIAGTGGYIAVKELTGNKTEESTVTAASEPESGSAEPEPVAEPSAVPEAVPQAYWIVDPADTGVTDVSMPEAFADYILCSGSYGGGPLPQTIKINLNGYPQEWISSPASYTPDSVVVRQDGLYGIYDYSGNVLYPVSLKEYQPQFAWETDNPVQYFGCTAFIVRTNNTDGYSDMGQVFTEDFRSTTEGPVSGLGGMAPEPYVYDGQALENNPFGGGDTAYTFRDYNGEDYQAIRTIDGSGNEIGYTVYDMSGNYIFEIPSKPKYFVNGYLDAESGGKYAVFRADGTQITDYIYDDVMYFEEGYMPVMRNGKWGLIDENGNEVTDFIWNKVSSVYGGKIHVIYNNYYGILNLTETLAENDHITENLCYGNLN